jgi:hypothetical protein
LLRWRIAVLVSVAIAISYLDRQTLPVAVRDLMTRLVQLKKGTVRRVALVEEPHLRVWPPGTCGSAKTGH